MFYVSRVSRRKKEEEKARNAGISLEPELIQRAKEYAAKTSFKTISNMARYLIEQELKKIEAGKPSANGKIDAPTSPPKKKAVPLAIAKTRRVGG